MRANFIRHIFPKTIDNNYRGNAISLILFIPITVVTVARSLIHIYAEDGGAQSIATIPLDSYSSCLLYTSPSPRDGLLSRMPSSA